MRDIEELTMAALEFAKAEDRLDAALHALVDEVREKKSDLSLGVACDYAEASRAWERADKRLSKAAKRIRRWL